METTTGPLFEIDAFFLRRLDAGHRLTVKIHPIGDNEVSVATAERMETNGHVVRIREGKDCGRLVRP